MKRRNSSYKCPYLLDLTQIKEFMPTVKGSSESAVLIASDWSCLKRQSKQKVGRFSESTLSQPAIHE